MDRISELPEIVLHGILYSLPMRDAVTTGVLSKRWNSILDSFPFWDFDQSCFYSGRHSPVEEARANYTEFVSRTLQRLRGNGIFLPKIRLYVTSVAPGMYRSLNSWIETAVHGEVQELDLQIEWESKISYTLPRVVFDSRSLTVLTLRGCKIGLSLLKVEVGNRPLRKLSLFRVRVNEAALRCLLDRFPLVEDLAISCCVGISSFSICKLTKLRVLRVVSPRDRHDRVAIEAPSLRRLHLEEIYIDDDTMGGVFTTSPLLEDFELVNPRGLRRLEISGLCHLERVDLHFCSAKSRRIDVKVPSLKYFCCICSPESSHVMLDMDVCRQLKELKIGGVSIRNDHFLKEFIWRFPLLQDLSLSECGAIKKIEISSPELRSISLDDCRKLKEIKIETPQLLQFHYMSRRPPRIFSVDAPCPLEIMLDVSQRNRLGNSFFLRLNALLSQSDRIKQIHLFMQSGKTFTSTFNILEFREGYASPSRNLDQLTLSINKHSYHYSALIDGLLWSCRPRSLLVDLSAKSSKDFAQVLCRKLMSQDLRNVGIESLVTFDEHGESIRWKLLPQRDWEVLVDSLPTLTGGKAQFRLQWLDTAC